ncbi:arsenosugar biosynthesis radical SAM (seleno)protein ArsS [Reichenbachiella sp. MALMAid0571]|uniref:arsenosugar biosynthesis radical SAM (seleno)protein ArsS n=1 Tax=Reichenbachiella sp. MALMAid0571 TaxID=3143939 RepID=UPI0032DE3CA0
MTVNTKISLKGQQGSLSNVSSQIEVLERGGFPSFKSKLENISLLPLHPTQLDIFQVNMGKMCNQVCKHCHVDAGPDRKEIMTKETMQQCLDALDKSNIQTVDLTGGAPEMNPDFRWFVEELSNRNKHIIVRCNLTIILANQKYNDLPEFYKKHNIEVVSSLPHFSARRTDSQRGEGVFGKSIKALNMLNEIGYGIDNSGLKLNLVFNPSGAFLPGDQKQLENEFKRRLKNDHNIDFNELYAITNLPISRFLDYLVNTGNYEEYMLKLIDAFNPSAAIGVMCRNTISISWDGYLYDCDFNQMLDLKLDGETPKHIKDFDVEKLESREIILNNHCYGCTAGAGSSCGGATA